MDEEAKAARRREIEQNVAEARAKQQAAEQAAKAALDVPVRGARALTKQQVVEKLDNVPVFSIVTADGRVVGVPDEAGEVACRFYADTDEVRSALVLAQHLNPTLPLFLGVTPLGTAYALAHAWTRAESPHPVRLQASKAVVAAVAEELGAAPDGAFPLFGCDELQSARLTPLFLSKADLHATWRAMGREAALPTQLTVSGLSSLVGKMLQDATFDWSTLMLVASEKATALAHEIQTAPRAASAAGQPADADDEPPPLE